MDSDAEAGFREFVAARSPDLMRVAFLLTGDYGEAEDAVQSTLAKMYLSWDRIRGRDVLPVLDAYARRTLARVVSSWRRKRRIQLVLSAAVPDTPVAVQEVGAVDDALLRALLALPMRQRTAVVLRFVEDRSEAEVADILGVSPGSVKQHTHRGLASLRAALSAPSEVPGD